MKSGVFLPVLLLSTLLFIPSYGVIKRKLSIAVNDFSVELLKTSFNSGNRASNTVLSPLSLYTVLAMIQQGAGGNTENEVTQVLHAQPTETRVGFKKLMKFIKRSHNYIQIDIASKLFVADGVSILPEFKNMTVRVFKSDIETVDFNQPEAAARTINDWVSEITQQRIQQLVQAKSINSDTRMMLLNAVFFSGEWEKTFDMGSTYLEEFHTLSGSSKNVSTMHQYGETYSAGHCSHIGAKFVNLIFKNLQYSMLVIVPDERDGLGNVINNLQGERLYNLTRRNGERYVNLALPKFKFETTSFVKNLLKTMGLQHTFADSANFSGIAGEGLKVSDVLQKAEIEVAENGAKASAATSVDMVPNSMGYFPSVNEVFEIDVDRPFLVFIMHLVHSVPIFSAWVGDP